MTSHVIAYRSLELLFVTPTFHHFILIAFLRILIAYLRKYAAYLGCWNTIRVSNGLKPDQAQYFIAHDLVLKFLNCLQKLSADGTSK